MNPPTFVKGPDRVVVENWVQEIKEIMVVLNWTDEQKVYYAAFKITGDEKHWWLSMKLLKEQRMVKITLTWERFKELFFDRYFPLFIKEEKIEEFTNLTQGNMTVGEYAAKFMELSCFAPFLIPNEARKVQNFSNLVDKASVQEKSIQGNTEPTERKKRPRPRSFQAKVSQGSGKKGNDVVCSK
ncbi:uncharacterized protein LOC131145822 [Malania oleifera]|uniref:uncharacterized protein LOC131145822 n=1 Tax=Malania oleifera TaxID=397392 RepID=UPI0025AE7233|nr:uncharacterized protein LOC131145822 [Malania oleifera]